jgi:hypothetical protein
MRKITLHSMALEAGLVKSAQEMLKTGEPGCPKVIEYLTRQSSDRQF